VRASLGSALPNINNNFWLRPTRKACRGMSGRVRTAACRPRSTCRLGARQRSRRRRARRRQEAPRLSLAALQHAQQLRGHRLGARPQLRAHLLPELPQLRAQAPRPVPQPAGHARARRRAPRPAARLRGRRTLSAPRACAALLQTETQSLARAQEEVLHCTTCTTCRRALVPNALAGQNNCGAAPTARRADMWPHRRCGHVGLADAGDVCGSGCMSRPLRDIQLPQHLRHLAHSTPHLCKALRLQTLAWSGSDAPRVGQLHQSAWLGPMHPLSNKVPGHYPALRTAAAPAQAEA